MHSWRGHYRARRQESYFFFSLQWQIKGCFDFCCTNNRLYLETVVAQFLSTKIFFAFCPNGNTRGKKRKQFCDQHIFYLPMDCPMHLAAGVGLTLWTGGMSFGSGISATFRMGKSMFLPGLHVCAKVASCDTGGFFHCDGPLVKSFFFFKTPNYHLIWVPADHIAGLPV